MFFRVAAVACLTISVRCLSSERKKDSSRRAAPWRHHLNTATTLLRRPTEYFGVRRGSSEALDAALLPSPAPFVTNSAVLVIDVQHDFSKPRAEEAPVCGAGSHGEFQRWYSNRLFGGWGIDHDSQEKAKANGGCLYVSGSTTKPIVPNEMLIRNVNALMAVSPFNVATQDWHPPQHFSFASAWMYEWNGKSYGGVPAGTTFVKDANQALWPDHCVAGSWGAAFDDRLYGNYIDVSVRKGMKLDVDSYSGFQDNDKKTKSPLYDILHAPAKQTKRLYTCNASTGCLEQPKRSAVKVEHDATADEDSREPHISNSPVNRVFVTGLALDFCVKETIMDALKIDVSTGQPKTGEGRGDMKVYVVHDAVIPVSEKPDTAASLIGREAVYKQIVDAGGFVITTECAIFLLLVEQKRPNLKAEGQACLTSFPAEGYLSTVSELREALHLD